jgi:mannonate dehydratase
MAEKLARRVNFLHIRNVQRDEKLNFREENLLSGDVDIPAIMKTMVLEDMRRSETIPGYSGIPVRPDHGARILGDYQEEYYPGYSLYGRMKNLAEIRGLEMGIRSSLGVDR